MLEFSAPESLRAEMEYRQSRARELARPTVIHSPGWLSRLFHRHPEGDQFESDRYDGKAIHRAA